MAEVSGLFQIPAEDCRRQPVSALVGSLGHLLDRLELLDGLDGPEDLLAADLHVVTHVGKHSGLREEISVHLSSLDLANL